MHTFPVMTLKDTYQKSTHGQRLKELGDLGPLKMQ